MATSPLLLLGIYLPQLTLNFQNKKSKHLVIRVPQDDNFCAMKHIILTTIAAVVLVGCGNSKGVQVGCGVFFVLFVFINFWVFSEDSLDLGAEIV